MEVNIVGKVDFKKVFGTNRGKEKMQHKRSN